MLQVRILSEILTKRAFGERLPQKAHFCGVGRTGREIIFQWRKASEAAGPLELDTEDAAHALRWLVFLNLLSDGPFSHKAL